MQMGCVMVHKKILFLLFLPFLLGATSTISVDSAGRVMGTGSAPSVSSCGTSPSIVGTDEAGTITMGTGVFTSCLLTFATAHSNAPVCMVNHQGAVLLIRGIAATTTLTIDTGGVMTAGGKVDYICKSR